MNIAVGDCNTITAQLNFPPAFVVLEVLKKSDTVDGNQVWSVVTVTDYTTDGAGTYDYFFRSLKDGLYRLTVNATQIYFIPILCTIKHCEVKMITELLCGEPCRIDMDKVVKQLKFRTYMNELMSQLKIVVNGVPNPIAITDVKLSNLVELIQSLLDMCGCKCLDDCKGDITDETDCGCNG